ncbi:MAG: hypothetical protein H6620_05405 [Halobacteriovoraceae bacterium]|nr:hypothetical protein [Halobacteriovoraceae bacterium]
MKNLFLIPLLFLLFSSCKPTEQSAESSTSNDLFFSSDKTCKCQVKTSKSGSVLFEWKIDKTYPIRGCKYHCDASANASDSGIQDYKNDVNDKVSAELVSQGLSTETCYDFQLRSAKLKNNGKEKKLYIAYQDFKFCPFETEDSGSSNGNTGSGSTGSNSVTYVCPPSFVLLSSKIKEDGKELGLCRFNRTQDTNGIGASDNYYSFDFNYGYFRIFQHYYYFSSGNDYKYQRSSIKISDFYQSYVSSSKPVGGKGSLLYRDLSNDYKFEIIIKTDKVKE